MRNRCCRRHIAVLPLSNSLSRRRRRRCRRCSHAVARPSKAPDRRERGRAAQQLRQHQLVVGVGEALE